MPIIQRFKDLPIIRRAQAAYSAFVGSDQAQTEAAGPRKPAPIRYAESPPLVGSAELETWDLALKRLFIQPEQQYQKYIMADAAMLLLPQLKAALKNYCYGAAGTFLGVKTVNAPNKQKVDEIFKRFIWRTSLKRHLPEIVRRASLYGNGYLQHQLERVNNSETRIKRLFWMPVYSMVRLSNHLDQFENTDEAFKQEEPSRRSYGTRDVLAILPEWAINQLRLFSLEGEPYGYSLIDSVLHCGAVQRVYEILLAAYWSRRYSQVLDVHSIKGPENMPASEPRLREHIERTSKTRRMEQGKNPARDLYVADGEVTRLQSDPNTNKIADIELQLELMLAELNQSPQMISTDRSANVGVLIEKFRQLYGAEEQHIIHFCEGLRESFDFELGLHGIPPADIEYEFRFGQQFLIQDLIRINQEARADLKENQITEASRLTIAGQLYRFDAASEAEELQKQRDDAEAKMREQMKGKAQTQPPQLTDGNQQQDPADPNSDQTDREQPDDSNQIN